MEEEKIELRELYQKTLDIFEAEKIDELGKNIMRACVDNDIQKIESFAKIGSLDEDWLQKIFQYYQADRKGKKQDFTPKTLADFAGRLVGKCDDVIDMCAGVGSMTIQKWKRDKEARFCIYEIDENAIPYLLLNMILRNIESVIYQGDVLEGENRNTYKIKKGDKYGVLEVMK